jgi:delta1-piperideine-2-carboxylate reductase|eukprot:COSAG02_NODE_5520_length_4262_cov_1.973337_3_plen_235_part_00
MAAKQPSQQHLTLAEARSLCHRALTMSGLHRTGADAVTEVVTAAERDECRSHGLFRVPGYCAALRQGIVDGAVRPTVQDVAPAVVRVDAGGGFAPPALLAGRAALVTKARANGIASLAIHNSRHFAALWWEVEDFAREGLVALAFVNSRSYVAHHGGKRRLYGTNPMAFAFPRLPPLHDAGGSSPVEDFSLEPLVWDQASSAMARGEISLHEQAGKPLPPGAAIDCHGEPTTDA